jgi:Bacterial Ig-like domain
MKKTLLLFTTTALALLLAAGTAWAALPAPTVVSTVPANGTTGVDPAADIRATFSEAMSTKSLGILNRSTTISTTSSQTFYLLPGNFTALSPTKNPPRFCTNTATGTTAPCPRPITATVSYNAAGTPTAIPPIPPNTAILNPSSNLLPGTTYTAVVEGSADGDFVAVKDADGTPMATDYIFSFTTAGTGNPGRG